MFPRVGAGSANYEDALVGRAGSGAVEPHSGHTRASATQKLAAKVAKARWGK
jgi:hypothetical protein